MRYVIWWLLFPLRLLNAIFGTCWHNAWLKRHYPDWTWRHRWTANYYFFVLCIQGLVI